MIDVFRSARARRVVLRLGLAITVYATGCSNGDAATTNAPGGSCNAPPPFTAFSLCGPCSATSPGRRDWRPDQTIQAGLSFEFGPPDGGNGGFSFQGFIEPVGWGGTYEVQGDSSLLLQNSELGRMERYDVTRRFDAACSLVGLTLTCAADSTPCTFGGIYHGL